MYVPLNLSVTNPRQGNLEFLTVSPKVPSMLSLIAAQPQKCCGQVCGQNMKLFCRAERKDSLNRKASHVWVYVSCYGLEVETYLMTHLDRTPPGITHTQGQWGSSLCNMPSVQADAQFPVWRWASAVPAMTSWPPPPPPPHTYAHFLCWHSPDVWS